MSRTWSLLAALSLAMPSAAAFAQQNLEFPVTDGEIDAVTYQAGPSPFAFVGGNFTYVGKHTGGMGILNLATGQLQQCPRVEGVLFACASDGNGGWFIGGQFGTVGTMGVSNLAHIAKVPGLNQWVLSTAWMPNPNGPVRAIVVDPSTGTVFVGGDFTTITQGPGQPAIARNRLASLSTTVTSAPVVNAWNPNVTLSTGSATVHALTLDANSNLLYAGGNFDSVGGTSHPFVAQFSSTSGAIQGGWNPTPNGIVRALAVISGGTDVFLGGDFQTLNGSNRKCIGKVTVGGVVGPWNANANGPVSAIAVEPANIYVGGSFTTIGGSNRKALAKIDDAGANPSMRAWNPSAKDGAGNGADVRALCRGTGDICVGGNFVSLGSDYADRLRIGSVGTTGNTDTSTVWDPRTLQLEDTFRKGFVHGMASDGTFMCVVGDFVSVGGAKRIDVAKINMTTNMVETGFNANLDPGVAYFVSAMQLDATATSLFIGGAVKSGTKFNALQLNAASGVVNSWAPQPNGTVRALEVFGSGTGALITLGGDFTLVNGTARGGLVVVDGLAALQGAAFPAVSGSVRTLCNDFGAGTLYAGGQFTLTQGGTTWQSAAKFNVSSRTLDTTWNPGLVPGSFVDSIVLSSQDVYLGGTYATVVSNGPANVGEFTRNTGSFTTWRARDAAGNIGVAGPVHAMARATDGFGSVRLWIGGAFNTVGFAPRQNIAALFDSGASAGQVVPTTSFTFLNDHPMTVPFVTSLVVGNNGGPIIAGGLFDRVNMIGGSLWSRPNLMATLNH